MNLLVEMARLGVDLFLYSDRPLHETYLNQLPVGSYQVRVSKPMRYLLWEQCWLSRRCSIDRVDLLHSPFNFSLPWSSGCPRVLTLHDAIHQVYYGAIANWGQTISVSALKTRLHHWVARVRAHQIITVSEHAKSDLIEHLNLPAKKIHVIYEAAERQFHEEVPVKRRLEVRRRFGLLHRYVFYIGGSERRKNVRFLLRGFAEANLENVTLLLAGGSYEDGLELLSVAESLGISDMVRIVNYVEDEYLPALYAEALCFVYPSEYEGFGLQLCEAMAVGCPTLAARATSLPEVLGEGGRTFSLSDTHELVELLRQVACDAAQRLDLECRAKTRSADFSWSKAAEQTLVLYERTISLR